VNDAPPPAAGTHLIMHNVILHENDLKLRVRWLRSTISPTKANGVPSFDEPRSFSLNIQDGAIAISLPDLSTAMNGGVLKDTPLRDVEFSQSGKQLKLNGIMQKVVPFPVEILSDINAAPDGRVHLHIAKIRVLKLPVKAIMKAFDIKTADIVDSKNAKGLQVQGDDIYIDPEQILPEPRKRGKLTDVHLAAGNIVEFYGTARKDIVKTSQWRNFISIRGGSLGFGKLAMENADIVMIDSSQDAWFDFDLSHYQGQLVNGTIRMTPQAGLRIFMPGASRLPKSAADITREWIRNRNQTPSGDLTP